MPHLVRRILGAWALAVALPIAVAAAPEDDYLAARNRAVTAAVEAAKAGRGGDQTAAQAEEAARRDLGRRMADLIRPLKLKGLGPPAYTLQVFVYGDDLATTRLDGMALASTDETVRVVVTPEPVLRAWLADRAKDKGAPASVQDGLKALVNTGYLVNNGLIDTGGGFLPYTPLPVTAPPGESVYANLGLFTEDAPADTLPNAVVVTRVAHGRAWLAMMPVTLDMKRPAACARIWKPYSAKIQALVRATEQVNDLEDPRFTELSKLEEEGATAFQSCFAKAPESQASIAAATRRAESFLQTLGDR